MANKRMRPKRAKLRPGPDETSGRVTRDPSEPKKATGPKRNIGEVERDYSTISALYLKGRTHQEIAQFISDDPDRPYTLTRQVISENLKTIREMWAMNASADIQEMVNKQLAVLDNLEAEMWLAYERSTQEAESSTTVIKEKATTKDGEGQARETVATVNTKGQAGDVRFLTAILGIVKERCAILGIGTASKFEGMARGGPEGSEGSFKFEGHRHGHPGR